MKHTVESLMPLADTYCERHYELLSNTGDARAALQSALTEVLAERDTLARNKLIDQDAFVALRAERDTLQSKCDEQALEIERLKANVKDLLELLKQTRPEPDSEPENYVLQLGPNHSIANATGTDL